MENHTAFNTLGRICKYRFWMYKEDDHTQIEFHCEFREMKEQKYDCICEQANCPFYESIIGGQNESDQEVEKP